MQESAEQLIGIGNLLALIQRPPGILNPAQQQTMVSDVVVGQRQKIVRMALGSLASSLFVPFQGMSQFAALRRNVDIVILPARRQELREALGRESIPAF